MRLGEGFGEALGRLWEALGGVGKALGSLCKALGGSGKALGGSRESAGAERNDAPLYIKKNNSRSTAQRPHITNTNTNTNSNTPAPWGNQAAGLCFILCVSGPN